MERRLLDGLNDRQLRAVTSPAPRLAILAGAGSGKTRVLTRRIAWRAEQGSLAPDRTLAVTFTRKAAGELRSRVARLGLRRDVTAGTFHALALAQLRRRWSDERVSPPNLLDRKVRILVPLLNGSTDPATEARAVAAEIEWAKARLVAPEGYEEAVAATGRATPRPAAEVAGIYVRYEEEKARRGLVDFDDLLLRLATVLEADPAFAAALRWRHRHIFVDEFQDVNPAQFRLLRAWAGPDPDLCVVGDDDQAVYGFTGADASYLVDFARHFPGAAVVRLEDNYRSTPQILATAHAVLPGGKRSKGALRPTRGDGPNPEVVAYPSDEAEAAGVARALRDAQGSTGAWSRLAVLYRTNAQSARFETALRCAGIPFRVRGAHRFLDRPEVAAALAELTRSSRAAPGLAFGDHLRSLAVWADEGPEERRTHADALAGLGAEYVAFSGGGGSVGGFCDHLATVLADDTPEAADAVELLTFHKAKGLEWPVTFVTGLERGFVPIAYAATPAALAEERRLLYVAMTRAEQCLTLSWAAERTLAGRASRRQPSPYLGVIQAVLTALAPGGDGDWRAAVAAERARLAEARAEVARDRAGPGAGADPDILAALVEWRRTLARASGVPAQVIFHDTTLALVAEARPVCRDALLDLPGLGPVKIERYGEALLEVLRRHAS